MPRISSEAVSASMWRSGGKPPSPPKYLTARGRRIWDNTVKSRPPDFFAGADAELLGLFAATMDAAITGTELLDPLDADAVARHVKLVNAACSLATKLRVCKSSSTRAESGELTERGVPSKGKKGADILLFGSGEF
jgi:hypothetical protein